MNVLDLSTETPYLTDEVQYREHEKKKKKNKVISSSKFNTMLQCNIRDI